MFIGVLPLTLGMVHAPFSANTALTLALSKVLLSSIMVFVPRHAKDLFSGL